MMKRFLAALLLIACVGMCAGCQSAPIRKQDHFATAIGISDITDKFIDDQPYVTVVLDDYLIQEYSLDYNEVTIAVEKSVYDKVTLNTGYCGISLLVTIPDDLPKADIGLILKAKRIENIKITSATTKDNVVLG